MSIKKKIIATALSGLAIAGFVAATTLAFPQLTNAQTETPAPATADAAPSGRGERAKLGGDVVNRDAYLAEALGITEDELDAAQTTAREAAIKQAVEDGLITQAQADALLNKTGGARFGLRGVSLDQETFLAEALGITVDELQAAQEKAAAAELAQAVADGRLTQEQADLVTAQRALQQYIEDEGLFESAVASAVEDGVITQAQADTILAGAKPGGFGFGGRGGMGDMGRGGHGGRGPMQDGSVTPDTQAQGSES